MKWHICVFVMVNVLFSSEEGTVKNCDRLVNNWLEQVGVESPHKLRWVPMGRVLEDEPDPIDVEYMWAQILGKKWQVQQAMLEAFLS